MSSSSSSKQMRGVQTNMLDRFTFPYFAYLEVTGS